MELNEIKSQLASLMNFGKIGVSSGTGSDAFAQILNRETEERPAAVREDSRAEALARDDRTEKKETRPDDKAAASEKKEKPTRKENRKAENKTGDERDDSINVPAGDVRQQQVEDVAHSEAENSATVEAPEAEAPQKDVDAVKNGAGAVLVSASDLSAMGLINVLNPENGEVMQMSGADLAAQLAGDDTIQVLMSTSQDGEPVFLIEKTGALNAINTTQQTQSGDAIDVGAFVPVEDGDAVDLNMESVKAQVREEIVRKNADIQNVVDELSDEKILDQATKLSEIIGKENKANIKVSVREEKIAQLSTKDLLADAKSVDEAVTISSKPAVVSAQANADNLQSQGNMSAANNNQNLNMTPVFNAAAPAAAESSAVSVAAPVSSGADINSVNLGTATAAGGEFVRAAKADAAENSQASFRDVYKGMSKEVVEQVKVNITKSAVKGIDKIDISLKPEDLGHIEVKMQIGKDGKLQAHIISTRPETMEALQKEMQTLEKAFNDAGFQTDEGSLSFSFRDGNQANQNQERENGLRNFIGDIFEKEASNDLLPEAFQNQTWDGTTGLNIRV